MVRKTSVMSFSGHETAILLSDATLCALAPGGQANPTALQRSIDEAIRYYFAEGHSGRGGWAYPGFRRDGDRAGQAIQVLIDAAAWERVGEEANRQEVTPGELLEHVLLFFLADRDAGRLASEDLGRAER